MQNTPLRVVFAGLAYLLALGVVAVAAFFAMLVLAGPHTDLLPPAATPVILALGWAAVLLLPALFARAVWRRSAAGYRSGGA